jgi:hypothetical protein
MRYFKVIRGFGNEDFIPIDESELEKAIYAQISGKMVIFRNGSINGSHISAIMPDLHRAMGWNYGYKLGVEDHREIAKAGVKAQYAGALEGAKDRVQFFIESGRETEIGTGVAIPDRENKKPLLVEGVRDLSKRFKASKDGR